MVIKVSYSDNDFRTAVELACTELLNEIVVDFPAGDESVQRFQEYLAENSLEDLKHRTVLAAVGIYIAKRGARGRFWEGDYNATLARFDGTLQYINKIIKVELVDTVNFEWNNGEVCFIDVRQKTIIVR